MHGSAGKPGSSDQALRTIQILVLALMAGVAMFMAVVTFLTLNGQGARSRIDAMVLLSVLAALLFVTTIVGLVIRSAVVGGIRRQSDGGREFDAAALMPRFMTLTIARAALAEGPALFGVVITLITGNWLGLAGGAAGLALLGMAFPTRGKFETFARDATARMM